MRLTRREAEVLDALAGGKANFGNLSLALGRTKHRKALSAVEGAEASSTPMKNFRRNFSAVEYRNSTPMKKPNLSRYAKKLSKLGLIAVAKEGRRRTVSLDSSIWMEFASLKGAFPTIKLSNILAGGLPFLLSFMKARGQVGLKEIDMAPATAKRLLSYLRKLGLVWMPKKGAYQLRDEAARVAGFCRNVLVRCSYAQAQEELGRIEYAVYSFDSADGIAAVFATTAPVQPKHYWPTAYSVAHQYGLQLVGAGKYYYSNNKPDLGDVALHIFAVSNDVRGAAHASALLLRNKYPAKRLLEKRQTFGLGRERIKELVKFIESRGKGAFGGMPSFEEVRGMQYESV